MAYTIHRYPANLIDVVHLADGLRLTIRPVLPQDADIVQAFVRELSDRSRRNRFFRAMRELPAGLLEEFTSIDYHRHLALVAEIFDGDREVIVGDARYVVGEDGRSAEFAIAVRDDWQGKGVGRLLLNRLVARATSQGIDLLFGNILPSNHAMQRLAHQAGFSVARDPHEPSIIRVEKTLQAGRGWLRMEPTVPDMQDVMA